MNRNNILNEQYRHAALRVHIVAYMNKGVFGVNSTALCTSQLVVMLIKLISR